MPIANCKIHPSVKIWHPELVNIYDSSIGEGCTVAAFVEIGGAKIGKNCKIGTQTYICPGTVIGDYSFVSHGARFCNVKEPRAVRSQKDKLIGATVGYGATIGAGAIIMPGIIIGERAFVGSGAVVTKSVESGITVVGNPARPLKYYARECKYFHSGPLGMWCGCSADGSIDCKCGDYESWLSQK